MPTVFTHGLVGLGLGVAAVPHPMPPSFYALAAGLGMLPDLDAITFPLGIPYRSRFGHRGFSHSFFCAALIGLIVGSLAAGAFDIPWWVLAVFAFVAVASHSLLDAITNGGLGVALFSPFDTTRYFLPWRPVQVSPIGRGFFSAWGLRALCSEIAWIWLPLGVLVGGVLLVRRFV